MSADLPIAVLGAGNWGTTLAQLAASNGHAVRLFVPDPAERDEINELRRGKRSPPGLSLAQGVRAVSDLGEAIDATELVFMVVPSQAFRGLCRALGDVLAPEQVIVHGTKGLEIGSHKRMSEILLEETCARQIGVLAGPNIAAEIAQGKPAGTVIASPFPRAMELVRRALTCARMLVFGSGDVPGVELCGALKNVVAIAAGMADELAVGDNAKALLMTRGMAELMRLAGALGAEPMTLAGLAGIGDLIVTCNSTLSRNHRVGVALARGEKLIDAVARLGMVAEGVYASRSACALARAHALELPLFERIDRVLHEGLEPRAALEELMSLRAGRDVAPAARPRLHRR